MQPFEPRPRNLTWRHMASGVLGLAFVLVLAACAAAGASPAPTVRPTPTPIAANVASPQDAAAIVIASNPVFAGTTQLNPDVIGASKWWTAAPLTDGGYQIEITVGWGDCMAGCIERHMWTYEVKRDGALRLISEQGDEVPVDLPA